ncbi:uncharacterized protein LOC136027402 isoform X2 [Artemia franciscana]|uniref:uncharacterized protein LOC136027402 isoform X2 n=1 Tax=Artemia franciscana TaxID=6661 RepID=UPI0032DA5753
MYPGYGPPGLGHPGYYGPPQMEPPHQGGPAFHPGAMYHPTPLYQPGPPVQTGPPFQFGPNPHELHLQDHFDQMASGPPGIGQDPPLMPGGYRPPNTEDSEEDVLPTSSLVNNPTGKLAKRLTDLKPYEKISLGQEFRDWRLNDTILHRNGLLYPIFSRTEKDMHIACNVCNTFVTGIVSLHVHRKGHKHAKALLGGPNVDSNLKARLDKDYEFSVVDQGTEQPAPQTPPKHKKKEKTREPTDLFQMKEFILVGLEYVIDVKDKDFVHCLLCDKSGTFKSMVAHIKGTPHRKKFLERHYPDVAKKFEKDTKEWKPQAYEVLELVATVIEKKLGRKHPVVITKDTYDTNRRTLAEKINAEEDVKEDQTIFDELSDPFEEGIDVKELQRKFGIRRKKKDEHNEQDQNSAPKPLMSIPLYQGPPGQPPIHAPAVGVNYFQPTEIAKGPVRYSDNPSLASIGKALMPEKVSTVQKQKPDLKSTTERAVDEKKNIQEEITKTETELNEVERKSEEPQAESGSTVEPEEAKKQKSEETDGEPIVEVDEVEKRKRELKDRITRLREELKEPSIQAAYQKEKDNPTNDKEENEQKVKEKKDDLEEMEIVSSDDDIQLIDKDEKNVNINQGKVKKEEAKEQEGGNGAITFQGAGRWNYGQRYMGRGKPPVNQKHFFKFRFNRDRENERDFKKRERRSPPRNSRPWSPVSSRRRSLSPKRSPLRRSSPVQTNKAPLSKLEMWKRMNREFKVIADTLRRKRKFLEKRPEDHPQYKKEWNQFWEKRSRELVKAGIDVVNYNFEPEWNDYWHERVSVIDEEELVMKKDELIQKYGLEGYDPEDDVAKPSRFRGSSEEEERREDKIVRNPSPPTSGRNKSPDQEKRGRSRSRSHSRRSRAGRCHSRHRSSEPKDATVLMVVRHLSTLENQLGSLMPMITSVFSRAVEAERSAFEGSDRLLEDSSVQNVLDMTKEKLIACLDSADRSARKAIKKGIDLVLALDSKMPPPKMSPRPENSVVSMTSSVPCTPLPNKAIDKVYFSQIVADILASSGRDSISDEALANLMVEILPGLNVKIEPEPPAPSSVDVQSDSFSNPLFPSVLSANAIAASDSSTASAVNSLQARNVPANIRGSVPSSSTTEEMFGGFSMSDLGTLIKNTSKLDKQLQQNLAMLLKKLEIERPEQFKKLKASVLPVRSKPTRERSPSPFRSKKRAMMEEGVNPSPPSPTPEILSGPQKRGISLNLEDFQPQKDPQSSLHLPQSIQSVSALQTLPYATTSPNLSQVASAMSATSYQNIAYYNQWLAFYQQAIQQNQNVPPVPSGAPPTALPKPPPPQS